MVIVLWRLGCGLPIDFCAREDAWQTRCGDPPEGAEVRACERSVRSCSDADIAVLDANGECLDAFLGAEPALGPFPSETGLVLTELTPDAAAVIDLVEVQRT